MSSTPSQPALPPTHRALVLTSVRDPLDIAVAPSHPTPTPIPGSAVIRILAATVVTYSGDIFRGVRPYSFPKPMVPGSSAVGRIAAVGPDAVALQPGQLVFVEGFIRARDDGAARFLLGLSEGATEGSRKLMRDAWRDGTYAEYARLPLENCYALDEARLLGDPRSGGLGYAVEDLLAMANMLVAYGGLRDVGLLPGEKVVVAPATGTFGGSAVPVALAMGAREVVAMGRNEAMLERLRNSSPRVRTVKIVGDAEAETAALRGENDVPAEVFFDISPPGTAGSSYFKAGLLSLGQNGRASLMGGQWVDTPYPGRAVTTRNLQLRGKWMYERDDVLAFVRLVEAGMVKLGAAGGIRIAGRFSLDEFEAAFDTAAANNGPGLLTVIVP
ncbi:hypothetical protein SLS62_007892 [Diatrype stigma]|uniref:Alcohol dehydrogenase-like N-terminal domain-containing protein n=1 Tax=Diatrype stigma TaxID=117547 RepID=A0AAN9UYH5_9PEZI